MKWNDTFIGLAGAAGTALIWAFKEWWSKRLSEKPDSIIQTHLDHTKMYSIMNGAMSDLGITRMLILYTENGGGVPRAGGPLYVSIHSEAIHKQGLQPIQEEFQKRLTDSQYTNMVSEVIQKGWWEHSPEEMEPGFLTDLYKREGVKKSIVVPVCNTKNRFYFLACRWHDNAIEDFEKMDVSTRRSYIATTQHELKEIIMRSE